jgi:hypothetical protein
VRSDILALPCKGIGVEKSGYAGGETVGEVINRLGHSFSAMIEGAKESFLNMPNVISATIGGIKIRYLVAILIVIGTFGMYEAALGECSWVLWTKKDLLTQNAASTHWNIETAVESKSQCDQVKGKIFQAVASQYKDVTKWPGVESVKELPNEGVMLLLKGGGSHFYSFFCIPDSIDPREKSN